MPLHPEPPATVGPPLPPPPPLGSLERPGLVASGGAWTFGAKAPRRSSRLGIGLAVGGAVATVAVGLVVVSLLGRGSSPSVRFTVPPGWAEIHGLTFAAPGPFTPVTSRAVGIDGRNMAIVQTYRTPTAINSGNLDLARQRTEDLLRGMSGQGVQILEGPTTSNIAGFPGFVYRVTALTPQGTHVESRILFAFSGTTEFFLNCQSTAEHRAEIEAGCDLIIQTFSAR